MRFSWKTARLLWSAETFPLSSGESAAKQVPCGFISYCSWMSGQNRRGAKQNIFVVNVQKENWMHCNSLCDFGIWTVKVRAASVDLGKFPKHGDSRNRKVQEKHPSINRAKLTSCSKWACPQFAVTIIYCLWYVQSKLTYHTEQLNKGVSHSFQHQNISHMFGSGRQLRREKKMNEALSWCISSFLLLFPSVWDAPSLSSTHQALWEVQCTQEMVPNSRILWNWMDTPHYPTTAMAN